MSEFVMPAGSQPVVMTDAAIEHFSNIAKNKIVKFSVEGGGCAGFQYAWKILEDRDALYKDDEVTEYDDFTFAVDGASLMFLMGSHVDYKTDITGSHIDVENPMAKAGCGCGVSINF